MSVIKPRILHPWLFCEMESIINSIIAESVWHQLMKINLGTAACQKFVFDIGKEISHIAKDGVANNGDADSDLNGYQYLQGNEGVARGFKMGQSLGGCCWADYKRKGKTGVAWIER